MVVAGVDQVDYGAVSPGALRPWRATWSLEPRAALGRGRQPSATAEGTAARAAERPVGAGDVEAVGGAVVVVSQRVVCRTLGRGARRSAAAGGGHVAAAATALRGARGRGGAGSQRAHEALGDTQPVDFLSTRKSHLRLRGGWAPGEREERWQAVRDAAVAEELAGAAAARVAEVATADRVTAARR